MNSDVEEGIRAVVRAFEETFATERRELARVDSTWRARLESQAFLLGPMSVLRAAKGERPHEGLANRGFANVLELGSSSRESPTSGTMEVTSAHVGCAVASVLAAVRAASGGVRVTVGARVKPVLREILAPLTNCEAISIDDAAEDAPRTRAAAVVAPFYYAKHDLERLVTHLSLEFAMPCPLADGGVELFVPSRWDQRWLFIDKLRAARSVLVDLDLDVRPLDVTIVDVEDTVSLLNEVERAMTERSFAALSAFVYPMLEESVEARDALKNTLSACAISIKNGRPSLGFWAHVGGNVTGATCRVEVPQILRAAPPGSWCERRCDFERTPTWGGAASSALRNAIPSALLP